MYILYYSPSSKSFFQRVFSSFFFLYSNNIIYFILIYTYIFVICINIYK